MVLSLKVQCMRVMSNSNTYLPEYLKKLFSNLIESCRFRELHGYYKGNIINNKLSIKQLKYYPPVECLSLLTDIIDWKNIYQTLPDCYMSSYVINLVNVASLIKKQQIGTSLLRKISHRLTPADWHSLSSKTLDDDFIIDFKDKISWMVVSYNSLSKRVINECKDYLNWYLLSFSMPIDIEYIKEIKDNINWNAFSRRDDITDDIIDEFYNYLDWNIISEYYDNIDEDFIRVYQHFVDWEMISFRCRMSEDFIEEFSDKVIWTTIARKRLSEQFIKKHYEKLSSSSFLFIVNEVSESFLSSILTPNLLFKQRLSDKFIIDNFDKINWTNLSTYNNFSTTILVQFHQYIIFDDLIMLSISDRPDIYEMIAKTNFIDNVAWSNWLIYSGVSERFIRAFINQIDWLYLNSVRYLSVEFLREFKERIIWDKMTRHVIINVEFLTEFKKFIDWSFFTQDVVKKDLNLVRLFEEYVDWDIVSSCQRIFEDVEFVEHYKDKLNWRIISCSLIIPEKNIKQFSSYVDFIQYKYYLSDANIDSNSLNVDITYQCMISTRSNEFLLKYKHMIDWDVISTNQSYVLCNEKFDEIEHLVNFDQICKYLLLSTDFMEKYIDKLNWDHISQYQKLPVEFITKYKRRLNLYLLELNISKEIFRYIIN